MRRVQFIRAECPSRARDIDGQITGQHGPHLHRASVSTKYLARAFRSNVECILQRPRRMIRHKIQCIEIEILGLNLGAVGNFPPHADENILNVLRNLSDRMHRSDGPTR